jgi:hypothetical protein
MLTPFQMGYLAATNPQALLKEAASASEALAAGVPAEVVQRLASDPMALEKLPRQLDNVIRLHNQIAQRTSRPMTGTAIPVDAALAAKVKAKKAPAAAPAAVQAGGKTISDAAIAEGTSIAEEAAAKGQASVTTGTHLTPGERAMATGREAAGGGTGRQIGNIYARATGTVGDLVKDVPLLSRIKDPKIRGLVAALVGAGGAGALGYGAYRMLSSDEPRRRSE